MLMKWRKIQMLEEMQSFFTNRVDGYDEHMISCVEGCKEAYQKIAQFVPDDAKQLLDLGCGTGLELEEIFRMYPEMEVTGIDLTEAMLAQLKKKYAHRKLNLINGDYFKEEFGIERYDVVVSCQTMHHFSHEDKTNLYTKIFHALREDAVYIECDYMVTSQEEEDFYFAENTRIRKEQNIPPNEFYHYDTPCTIDNQKTMLLNAGFKDVELIWREGNTTLMVAHK